MKKLNSYFFSLPYLLTHNIRSGSSCLDVDLCMPVYLWNDDHPFWMWDKGTFDMIMWFDMTCIGVPSQCIVSTDHREHSSTHGSWFSITGVTGCGLVQIIFPLRNGGSDRTSMTVGGYHQPNTSEYKLHHGWLDSMRHQKQLMEMSSSVWNLVSEPLVTNDLTQQNYTIMAAVTSINDQLNHQFNPEFNRLLDSWSHY